jgi:hypothetical protein
LDARDPVRALADYAGQVESLLREEGRLGIDLIVQTTNDRTMADVDRRSGDNDERDYVRFFERCRDAGTVRAGLSPERAAALFFDVWAGSVRRWSAGGRAVPLAQILKEKLDDLFIGLGPKESRDAQA